jgi:hypothetical protein
VIKIEAAESDSEIQKIGEWRHSKEIAEAKELQSSKEFEVVLSS